MKKTVESLELHLDYDPGSVIKTKELVDVGCGMYPVYYYENSDHLLVSTSATELIFETGEFKQNYGHDLPEDLGFLLSPSDSMGIGAKAIRKVPTKWTSHVPDKLIDLVVDLSIVSPSDWEFDETTADSRISRLRPFERISPGNKDQHFDPDFSISSPDLLLDTSADLITQFVNQIEEQYPGYHHVVLTGGKDSQMIHLIPKASENWHMFSASPNHKINNKFLDKNNIDVQHVFGDENNLNETEQETINKLIFSDVRNPPKYMQWRYKLRSIAEQFDGKCIFWNGTAGDTIYSYYPVAHRQNKRQYFDIHLGKMSAGNAITHQVTKNITGCPLISIYHFDKIWQDVFTSYNPNMMSPGDDLRPQLGKQLFGEEVWWPQKNPGPAPYQYDSDINPKNEYLEYISTCLNDYSKSIFR